ncbi:hypothetical protein [Streptomyces hydrogenans]|uniref:hypothetical protein n=1 Tax=Streptomyces hydrogenans TaxID=1873719 RepID=UPI0033E7E30C
MTDRRTLGPGPASPPRTAAQADLADLPSVYLPDVDELRRRGVLDAQPAGGVRGRRALGQGIARGVDS